MAGASIACGYEVGYVGGSRVDGSLLGICDEDFWVFVRVEESIAATAEFCLWYLRESVSTR